MGPPGLLHGTEDSNIQQMQDVHWVRWQAHELNVVAGALADDLHVDVGWQVVPNEDFLALDRKETWIFVCWRNVIKWFRISGLMFYNSNIHILFKKVCKTWTLIVYWCCKIKQYNFGRLLILFQFYLKVSWHLEAKPFWTSLWMKSPQISRKE